MIKKFVLGLIILGCLYSGYAVLANADLPQADSAGTALQEGRRLLKRGKSDQALSQLQKALSLYTASKNNHGIAAAENELGDLYLRQGEYNVVADQVVGRACVVDAEVFAVD